MAEAGPSRLPALDAAAGERVTAEPSAGTSRQSNELASSSRRASGEGARKTVTATDHPLARDADAKDAKDHQAAKDDGANVVVGEETDRGSPTNEQSNDAAGPTNPATAGSSTAANTSSQSAVDDLRNRLFALEERQGVPSRPPNTPTAPRRTSANNNNNQQNEALMVRRNMLRTSWESFSLLGRFAKWIFIARLATGVAQLGVGIAILSLPTSLGDSMSTAFEVCDPEGMFIYLFLHTMRVFVSLPVDFYLGLSPHRSARLRRPDSAGHAERERNRRMGSLRLDRKVARLSDLLNFFHIVLFIFGNYIVWTNTACNRYPADSIPLFYTCVAMLSITYLIIAEVALIAFLVIFFLPMLIAIMSALGLSHRLPHRAIHPETDKISTLDIEKHSRLVYYTPEPAAAASEAGAEKDGVLGQAESGKGQDTLDQGVPNADTPAPTASEATGDKAGRPGREQSMSRRFMHVFGFSRPQRKGSKDGGQKEGQAGKTSAEKEYKYPLFAIPAHRATCPICLCDYEEVTQDRSGGAAGEASAARSAGDEQRSEEVEPLRLLECGHAMHRACVDQWLTTVSGRCPVCQRPLLDRGNEHASSTSQGANANNHDSPA